MYFSNCKMCGRCQRNSVAFAIIVLLMSFASCDRPSSVEESSSQDDPDIVELQLDNPPKSEDKMEVKQSTDDVKTESNTTVEKLNRVGYRLVSWTKISDNTDSDLIEKLTKFGCEFQTVDGSDVSKQELLYRCPKWKWCDFQIEKRILGWAGWLERNHFETVVINSSIITHPHSVKYRLNFSRSVMLQTPITRNEIAEALKVIGCEVELSKEKDNSFKFSCPRWQTLFTSNHEHAHGWLNWLQESGFETVHTHTDEFGHTHEPGQGVTGTIND